jgi:hypothetical protein
MPASSTVDAKGVASPLSMFLSQSERERSDHHLHDGPHDAGSLVATVVLRRLFRCVRVRQLGLRFVEAAKILEGISDGAIRNKLADGHPGERPQLFVRGVGVGQGHAVGLGVNRSHHRHALRPRRLEIVVGPFWFAKTRCCLGTRVKTVAWPSAGAFAGAARRGRNRRGLPREGSESQRCRS